VGLYHFGLKVGDTDDELRAALARLQEAGVPLMGTADHGMTHSLYLADPDGNEIELYIDVEGDRLGGSRGADVEAAGLAALAVPPGFGRPPDVPIDRRETDDGLQGSARHPRRSGRSSSSPDASGNRLGS
jgi:hypothetical protein